MNRVAHDGTLDALDKIRVAILEKGRNAEPFELYMNRKDSVREHVACHNPLCFNGGFSMGDVIRDMVRGRQEQFIGTNFCTGQEGDPEEEGPHPSCQTRFEVEAMLRFR